MICVIPQSRKWNQTLKLHEHYTPCLDDKTPQDPNLLDEACVAHDQSSHCVASHHDAWFLESDKNLMPEKQSTKFNTAKVRQLTFRLPTSN